MNKKILILLGLFSIFVCLSTWILDLTGLVEECIYCRTQRTIIGILGIILLMPFVRYVTAYFASVFGFMGAHVSAAQIFLNIKHNHTGLMFILATGALFFIFFLLTMIYLYDQNQKNGSLYKK